MTQASVTRGAPWWQLTIQVPQRWAEDASATLIECGALGVQTIDAGAEPTPSFARDALVGGPWLGHARDKALLVASYAGDAPKEDLTERAVQALKTLNLDIPKSAVQLRQRTDTDWAERWKQYFKPLKLGRRVWVVPSWEKSFEPPTGSLTLSLDPGMAFGTGQHATTALCMKAVELYADRISPVLRAEYNVCDLGCGTGILGLGAAKLGFGRVLMLDNDPQAVSVTRDNAQKNGVHAQVHVDGMPIGSVSDSFALFVANILAQPLIDMAPAIAARLRPGGILILSGLLRTQADLVQRTYEHAGHVQFVQRWTHGEWAALAMQRLGAPLF